MSKRLYVGNLSFATTAEELRSLFEGFGPVDSVQVLTDRETSKSRGFAFVEMADDAGAAAAIRRLDGDDFQGRRLNISEARARTTDGGPGTGPGSGPRGRGGRDGGGGYGGYGHGYGPRSGGSGPGRY